MTVVENPGNPSRTRALIRIIAVIDQFDLRKVVSQKVYLRALEEEHKLKNLEAVVFTNKTLTRFRVVMKMRGQMFVCMPWIDQSEQHSLYLKINEELSAMSHIDCKVKLEELHETVRQKLLKIARRNEKR